MGGFCFNGVGMFTIKKNLDGTYSVVGENQNYTQNFAFRELANDYCDFLNKKLLETYEEVFKFLVGWREFDWSESFDEKTANELSLYMVEIKKRTLDYYVQKGD